MIILQDLTSYIKKIFSSHELNNLSEALPPLERILLNGIITGQFSSDTDASKAIYNSHPTYPAFKALKSRLRESLIDSVMTYRPRVNNRTSLERVYVRSMKEVAFIKFLSNQQYRKTVIKLSENLLRQTEKYLLNEFSLELRKILFTSKNVFTRNKDGSENELQKINELTKVVDLEFKAQAYYSIISQKFSKKKFSDPEKVIQEMDIYIQELSQFEGLIHSPIFHNKYYSLCYIRAQTAKDFKTGVCICTKAISYFSSLPFEMKAPFRFFRKYLAESKMELENYDEAVPALKQTINEDEEGTLSWMRSNEILMISYFRLSDFNKAYKIFDTVSSHPRFKSSLPSALSRWNLYETYFYILFKMNQFRTEDKIRFKKNYIPKSAPGFTTDKKAMNIPVIISEILIEIIEGKDEEIIERTSALEKYTGRYLTKGENFRSKCFIKMLLQLPQRNFHPQAVRRHTSKFLDKLMSVPISEANQAIETEVIPYENLWKVILDYLGQPKK